MIESSKDPNQFIASLARGKAKLELITVDICFLAGLYFKADKAALSSFEEETLIDIFEQTCDMVEPDAENPRKRATHAIQRLRDQRMLARVDGAGIVRTGEYSLTRLAASIVEFYLSDEALTRESLTLLTGTLRAQIAEILAAAKKADSEEQWRSGVIGPLRITVGELVAGIERRQRGLDAQQEEVQAEIAKLLSADWFSAIERCQALLEETTNTLHELNEVLLRDTHQLVALLQEIQTLAEDANVVEAEATTQRVIEHIDRIAAWGSARQRAWSDYYQYVHRYLRDVVRLDPDRALSQRLRDQLASWPKRRFCFIVAHRPSIRLLRALEERVERPPVSRLKTDREQEPLWVVPEDSLADLEAMVSKEVDTQASSLAEIMNQVLPQLQEQVRYIAIGRVSESVAALCYARSSRTRPWRSVFSGYEIEDWTIERRREP